MTPAIILSPCPFLLPPETGPCPSLLPPEIRPFTNQVLRGHRQMKSLSAAPHGSAPGTAARAEDLAMTSTVQVIQDVYQAFGQGDIPAVLAHFHPSIEWRLAEGYPYSPEGRPWCGPDAIARHFFARAGGEWEGSTVSPRQLHDARDTVVLECRYTGVYKPTERRLDAQACHVWKVSDGKVTSFQQYIDTARLQDVMGMDQGARGQ